MKENPNSEGRRPKEGRKPKAENRRKVEGQGVKYTSEGAGVDQERFQVHDEWGAEPMVLHDGPTPVPPKALGERTAQFGEAIIRFAKKIPQNPVNNRLIQQLVGAATSIGANYCEADDSVSGRELKQKIGTSRKESKETMFFLRMVAASEESLGGEARALWREAKELNLIFGAIWRK